MDEERKQEELFIECIISARKIIKEEGLLDIQSHILSIATTLFNVRVKKFSSFKDEVTK